MIRLELAEDHTIVRWALREALSKADDIEVVGEAGTAAETLAMVQNVKPDVLLLDITLPDPVATGRDLLKPELGRPYRLIGIGMADIQDAVDAPPGLFQTSETRTLNTERAIDRLREKFGKNAVIAGRALKG